MFVLYKEQEPIFYSPIIVNFLNFSKLNKAIAFLTYSNERIALEYSIAKEWYLHEISLLNMYIFFVLFPWVHHCASHDTHVHVTC